MGDTTVYTTRVDGTGRYYLDELGRVAGLVHDDTMPGGPNQASMTLQYDPALRHEAFSLGRRVVALRGGTVQWEGTMLNPVPTDGGWALTANGIGNQGGNYDAVYTTWDSTVADQVVGGAIGRGLRWVKGSVSGGYLLEPKDSASLFVADFLNGISKPQSQTWRVRRVNAGWQVDLMGIPTAVTRLLVTTVPAARTVAGYYNALFAKYEAASDFSGSSATYGTVSATNPASIAQHDRLETFWDLSGAGLMTAPAATALAQQALAKYTAASYANGFTVGYGQYMTVGGTPVDLGTEHAGEVVRLIFASANNGAELTPGPVVFTAGSVSYDNDADQLTIVPFQAWNGDIGNLLQILAPTAPA